MFRRLPLVGALLAAAGFVFIGASWFAAHGRGYVDEQFPALVAGSAFGLGLIMLGVTALSVSARDQAFDKLADRLLERGAGAGSPPAPGPARGTNGTGDDHAWADAGEFDHPTLVIPRRTLFHDPGCRLVTSADDTEVIERSDAVAAGLAACRVCRP